MRAVLALLLAAVVALAACGDDDGGGGEPSGQNGQEAKRQECFAKYEIPADISACVRGEEPAAPEEPEEPETAQKVLTIGQDGRDEGLGFKVLSLEQVESIPAADEFEESIYPPPGGKLYQAVVQIKNFGQTAADPFCGGVGGAVLLDINDRNYEYEDPVGASGNDWICLDGVAPGFTAEATLGFKVPRSFRMGGLVLWDTDSSDYDGSESNLVVVP
jgi:hypothetical protein